MLQQTFYTLLLQLAASAALASLLARSSAFQRMILRDQRTINERFQLALVFALVFGAGVTTRILTGTYQAADLSLAGAFLAGLLGGYFSGLLAGVLIALPALVLNSEYMAMPLLAGVGVLSGLLRDIAPDPEETWRFSPFFELLGSYRFFRADADKARPAFQLLILLSIVFCDFLRLTAVRVFGTKVIHTPFPKETEANAILYLATMATTLFCVAIPIRVWNSLRTEKKLEAQARLLTETRLSALTYQINPHFLFNTLNSVSTLIRLDPEEARGVVYKLSNILRRILRKSDNLTTLREELSFIDDYLAIEKVRFREKLKFEKEIAPDTLDFPVPSMFLQPLIENSIKHGIGPKVDGGRILIRAQRVGDRLVLLVEDNGVGIPEDRLANVFQTGIGVSNVNERLQVLFGDQYRMYVDSTPGKGTKFEIEMPSLIPDSVLTPLRAGK